MTIEILRTERLTLRTARWDDVEPMHEVLGDEEAMRYWSSAAHRSFDETEIWLESMIQAPADQSHDFIVEHQGKVIGKAGCWRLPEIGFILRRDHWGRGLAREALRAVINSTFARFNLPALTGDVDPRNEASLRLLHGLGFEVTGRAGRTYCIDGAWADSIYLALSRDSWSVRG